MENKKSAKTLLEEAIPEAGASGKSFAGGTQKLELLGVSALEVPRSWNFWGFLLEVDPEAGASGRNVL